MDGFSFQRMEKIGVNSMRDIAVQFKIRKYTYSIWINPPQPKSWDFFTDLMYDNEIFGALCIWVVNFGWWRDAEEKDWKDE